MSYALPERLHSALDALSLPDRDKSENNQLALIQRLQIAHYLECRDEQPAVVQDVWWSQLPGFVSFTLGSVSLVYSLFVARQFFVRCAYFGGCVRGTYDPTRITEARALGTRFDLAVAKHVFGYFLTESAQRWEAYAADNNVPRIIEYETQFVYGLWQGIVPEEGSQGNALIASHTERLNSEAKRRFAKCVSAPYPHQAVRLSSRSQSAHQAGHLSQSTLKPTTPSALQGGNP